MQGPDPSPKFLFFVTLHVSQTPVCFQIGKISSNYQKKPKHDYDYNYNYRYNYRYKL